MTEKTDIAVLGAGAAGLMAAIHAGRRNPRARVLLIDGAEKLGAKILMSGGGRCNVTHHAVSAADFAGASPRAIAKVLKEFDVPRTVAFFGELGVELKQESTGKLFPVTDDAANVLQALLRAAHSAGVSFLHPFRVERITRLEDGRFQLAAPSGLIEARRLVLATGGRSLPRTGSDGAGYEFARALGHTVTRTFPALVPLTLPSGHWMRGLSGLSALARLSVRAQGKPIASHEGMLLCTHFGISGPVVLDISRHWIAARLEGPAELIADWLPGLRDDELDEGLRALGAGTPAGHLRGRLPERLARSLCEAAGVDPAAPGAQLTREKRRALLQVLKAMPLPATGDRGFAYAEVTAGGVPLDEINLPRMESRRCPGLFLCGEICNVDGRIGGFNFQWAWSSGVVAGSAV